MKKYLDHRFLQRIAVPAAAAWQRICFGFWLLTMALTAGAQGLEYSPVSLRSSVSGFKGSSETPANWGYLRWRSESFLSPDFSSTPQTHFQSLEVQLRNTQNAPEQVGADGLLLKGDITGVVSTVTPALHNLNISQFYIEVGSLSVGRRKMHWSWADENWKLGLYQPNSLMNPLTPNSQGLTGFFLHLSDSTPLPNGTTATVPKGLHLMGTFVHLPDQQAGYEIRNGQFQSVNPWFPRLPERASFGNSNSIFDSLSYEPVIPQTSDIVFQQGYGAQGYLGSPEGPWGGLSASWSVKPSHQFALGIRAYGAPGSKIVVPIKPQTYRHHLFGVDYVKSWGNWKAGISFIRERPQDPSFSSEWTFVSYRDSQILSPFLEWEFQNWKLQFSHLEVLGAESIVQGPLASQVRDFLPPRYGQPSSQSLQVEWKQNLKKAGTWVRASTRYVINASGASGGFGFWHTQIHYQWVRRWGLSLGGLFVSADPAATSSVYGVFQNHDQIQTGIHYGF